MDVPMSASQQSMGALMEEAPLQKIPVIGARLRLRLARRWPAATARLAACVDVARRVAHGALVC
jgi:hypothetical protein